MQLIHGFTVDDLPNLSDEDLSKELWQLEIEDSLGKIEISYHVGPRLVMLRTHIKTYLQFKLPGLVTVDSAMQFAMDVAYLTMCQDAFQTFLEGFMELAGTAPQDAVAAALTNVSRLHHNRELTYDEAGNSLFINFHISPAAAKDVGKRRTAVIKKKAGVRPGNKPNTQRFVRKDEIARIKNEIRTLWRDGTPEEDITEALVAERLGIGGPETGEDTLRKRLRTCGVRDKWPKFRRNTLTEPETNNAIN